MFEEIRRKYVRELAEETLRNLKKRGWITFYVDNIEECRARVLEIVRGVKRIGVPGSVTVRELKLIQLFEEKGIDVVEHWNAKSVEEANRLRREEVFCEAFIHSPNAVSTDGHIVVLDYYGNRIAGSILGPEKLVFIAGYNKIESSLERVLERAEKIAVKLNAIRFGVPVEEMKYNILVLKIKPPAIKEGYVILVGENLGF
ncbi:MAG: hypothetical protein DRJ63_10030 [Thermoprotei archaeon]|nr:MAG: hypothetical protein DRJ63_10030 [Thermoprotei archaeon]